MNLIENTLAEALSEFPEVLKLDSFLELANQNYDFYFAALGFEERTLSIPENLSILSQENGFRCDEIIYFTYETSTADNSFNEPRFINAFSKIYSTTNDKSHVVNMVCDEEGFLDKLYERIQSKINLIGGRNVSILLDISVCSSKLILNLFKVLFKVQDVNVKILYSEAATYFPTYEEFITNKASFLEDSELSTTRGIEDIINSNEYSEGAKENTDLVIAFAPFKVGRINKIVSDIDESILLNSENRLFWIIGDPNFTNNRDRLNRIEMIREINGLLKHEGQEVSTLNYKATLEILESIYQKHSNYHINIADLGSKMQTIGISIFYYIRPDVSVYYALPKQYNSSRYSQGTKCHWKIDFGDFRNIIRIINKVDTLDIRFKNEDNLNFFD